MNATAPADIIEVTDYHNGSDSDTNIDDDEYYQPVSAEDDEDQPANEDVPIHPPHPPLANGVSVNQVQLGISSLQLNDGVAHNNHDVSSDDEEDEEEAASESAVMRAFREDESRRNMPLTAENAARVREAMRGVSFAGAPPPWAGRLAAENWIRLGGLGRSSRS